MDAKEYNLLSLQNLGQQGLLLMNSRSGILKKSSISKKAG
jgi:hypothetical protein